MATANQPDAKGGFIGCSLLLLLFFFLVGTCSGDEATDTAPTAETSAGTESDNQSIKMTHQQYVDQIKREIASIEKGDRPSISELKQPNMLMMQVAVVGAWSKMYSEHGKFPLNKDEKKLVKKFQRLIGEEQYRRFPLFREAQAQIFDEKLWENNIDVAAIGKRNTNLRSTGGIFASNAAVKQGYESMHETLSLLRFKRATFEWYRGSEYQYYDLDTMPDGQVATLTEYGWVPLE